MDRHVFISYRRSDGAFVDELIVALNGYTCWRDTAEIAGGQVWREEIIRAIEAAYAMILVVSADTEQSKEVYAEYFYALGRKLPVIPLLIADYNLPFGLENINSRLWFEDRQRALQGLRGDLDRYRARAASIKPASDMRTYLGAMQLGYLMAVGNYTPMAGKGGSGVSAQRDRYTRSSCVPSFPCAEQAPCSANGKQSRKSESTRIYCPRCASPSA